MTTAKIDRKLGHEVERHPDGALTRHTCFEPHEDVMRELVRDLFEENCQIPILPNNVFLTMSHHVIGLVEGMAAAVCPEAA